MCIILKGLHQAHEKKHEWSQISQIVSIKSGKQFVGNYVFNNSQSAL